MSSDYMVGDKDNAVIVPFSDDESATAKKAVDLEDEDSPTASPEERKNRRQRRQERLQKMLQEGEANAAKVKELEERDAKRERELAEMRGMLAAQHQMRQAANDNGKDPTQAALDAVYARQKRAYDAAQAELKAGNLSPERQKYYEDEARAIETEKTRIHTQAAISRAIAEDRETRRVEQAQQVWVSKYPEVYNNPRAFAYAQATYNRRVHGLGEQSTHALVEEVMQEAINTFKLGAKPAPTASDRARMSGIPSSGSGGGGRAPSGVDFTRNPELRRMALAAYSDLPEQEALKKWTDTVGKKLREKKVI